MSSFKVTFALLSACPLFLCANPQHASVMEGSASFEGVGSTEMIIHTSDRAILHWDSFSIDSRETTRFIQGNANAAVLNRVTGDSASYLLGQLLSDGKVYLVNPNGVLMSKEAVIDVGSFVASSFDVSNEAFLAGANLLFEGTSEALLVNAGTIKARNGDILLLAHRNDE